MRVRGVLCPFPSHSFFYRLIPTISVYYSMDDDKRLGRINQVKLHITCLIREAISDQKIKFMWHFKGILRAFLF